MSDEPMVFRAGPGVRWTGVYFFGNGRQSFWHLTCPCGVTAEYPVNGLPETDTPHPCGNSDHWTVRYAPGATPAATPSARCVVVPRELDDAMLAMWNPDFSAREQWAAWIAAAQPKLTTDCQLTTDCKLTTDALLDRYGFTRLNWEADPALMADLINALDER